MWNGDFIVYDGNLFLMWIYGSVSWSTSWNGAFWGSDDPFYHWNGRDKNCLDLLDFSKTQIIRYSIYFVSSIMDHNDHITGDLLLFCEKTAACARSNTTDIIKSYHIPPDFWQYMIAFLLFYKNFDDVSYFFFL